MQSKREREWKQAPTSCQTLVFNMDKVVDQYAKLSTEAQAGFTDSLLSWCWLTHVNATNHIFTVLL